MKHALSSEPPKKGQRRNLIIAIVGASILILGSLAFVIGGTSRETPVDTKTVSSAGTKTTSPDGSTDPSDPTTATGDGGGGGGGGGSKSDAERQAARAEREAKRDQSKKESESRRAGRQDGSTSTTAAPIGEETTTTTASVPTTDSTELAPPSTPTTTDSTLQPTTTIN
jgi:hypothetical protein